MNRLVAYYPYGVQRFFDSCELGPKNWTTS